MDQFEQKRDRIWFVALVVLSPVAFGLFMPMVGNVIAEQFYGTAPVLKAMEQFFAELFEPESRGFFAFNAFPFAFYCIFILIKFFTSKGYSKRAQRAQPASLEDGLAQWCGSMILAPVACVVLNFLNLKLVYTVGSSMLFLLLYPTFMFPALIIGHYIGGAMWRVMGDS